MRIFLSAALAVCACGEPLPMGLTRGSLLSIEAGLLEVRGAGGVVYDCTYDSHTFFQRDHWPVQSGQLSAGDPVEVLTDRRPGSRTCYARMLSVVHTVVARPAAAPRRPLTPMHGSLTLSGLVTREDASSLTLKTRDGERTVRVRLDTSFSHNGLRSTDRAALLNQHVFIRGGGDMHGALEAYQIMWGKILTVP